MGVYRERLSKMQIYIIHKMYSSFNAIPKIMLTGYFIFNRNLIELI